MYPNSFMRAPCSGKDEGLGKHLLLLPESRTGLNNEEPHLASTALLNKIFRGIGLCSTKLPKFQSCFLQFWVIALGQCVFLLLQRREKILPFSSDVSIRPQREMLVANAYSNWNIPLKSEVWNPLGISLLFRIHLDPVELHSNSFQTKLC